MEKIQTQAGWGGGRCVERERERQRQKEQERKRARHALEVI